MYKNKRSRKMILGGLLCLLLIMMVGYAAFYSQLQISGISEVTSLWDVEITNIEKSLVNGNVTEFTEPSYTKNSANFSVGLEKPGDYIYYKIEVTNKGTIAAIATLGNLTCGDSDAIKCGAYPDSDSVNIGSNQDLTSSRLIIGPNEKEYYNVWVSYDNEITNQPEKTNTNITLELKYEQSDVGVTHTTEDKCYTSKVLENGTLEITNYDESCGTDIVIPATIGDYPVTEIADGRYDYNTQSFTSPFANKGITSVVLPNTITKIGYAAFHKNNISDLTIPSSVKIIKTYAFTYNKLDKLVLNNGLETIDSWAFEYNQLTEVKLPTSLKIIGIGAFTGNLLTSVDIPSSVTDLKGAAFNLNNFEEKSAYIFGRNSDGTVDYSTIVSYGGKEISNFTLPSTVENIDSYAFWNVKIQNLTLPPQIKSIGERAFQGSQLYTLNLNNELKTIGNYAFYYNALTNINIPNSVEMIGNEAFRHNRLKTVTIGNGIKSIGIDAFKKEDNYNPISTITIDKISDSISGSPWGATNAKINWIGTN